MDYYIGIDVGTSSAKLILIDEQGNTRKQAEREYRFSEPQPGWKEIDPEIWTRAVEEAMADLLQGEEPEKIRAIGVTGQMHTGFPFYFIFHFCISVHSDSKGSRQKQRKLQILFSGLAR